MRQISLIEQSEAQIRKKFVPTEKKLCKANVEKAKLSIQAISL